MKNPPLLIQHGSLLLQDKPTPVPANILLADGKIERIAKKIPAPRNAKVIDATGLLMSPPFVESHIHLDSALIDAGRCLNQSGTLLEGIEKWREIKKTLRIETILERAEETLRRQAEQGEIGRASCRERVEGTGGEGSYT